jgi:putative exosortase-associated protein (TIGR04073 family)
LNTAFLEIPKSVISVTNESNLVYGMTGGAAKGMVNAMGRLLSGMIDLITAPVLTKPIVKPDPIWEDFDAETSYGQVFRLDNEPYKAGNLDNANAAKDE